MVTVITALLVSLLGFGTIATIYMIGKPRKPLTPGVAVATLITSGLQIAGVLYLAAH